MCAKVKELPIMHRCVADADLSDCLQLPPYKMCCRPTCRRLKSISRGYSSLAANSNIKY